MSESDSEKVKSIARKKHYKDLIPDIYFTLAKDKIVDVDFIVNSYLTEPELLKLPAYALEISYNSNWSASFGYTRTEHYTEYVKVKVDGYWRTEPKTRKKQVTDWRPASGTDSGRFILLCYAGSKHPAANSLLPSFSKIGSTKEVFQKSLSEDKFLPVLEIINKQKDKIDFNITEFAKQHKKGDKQKDWSISYDYSYNFEKYALPLYFAHVHFKGKSKKIYFSTEQNGGYVFNPFERVSVDNSFVELAKNWRITVGVGTVVLSLAAGNLSSENFNFIGIVLAVAYSFYVNSCISSVKDSDSRKIENAFDQRIKSGFIGKDSTLPDHDSGPEIEWRTPEGKRKFLKITAIVSFVISLATFKDWIMEVVARI